MKFPRLQAVLAAFGVAFAVDRIVQLEFGLSGFWLHFCAVLVFFVIAFFLEYRFTVIGDQTTSQAFSQNVLWTSTFFGLIGVVISTLLQVGALITALIAVVFALVGLLGTRVLEPKRH
jgi:hypothetical protein